MAVDGNDVNGYCFVAKDAVDADECDWVCRNRHGQVYRRLTFCGRAAAVEIDDGFGASSVEMVSVVDDGSEVDDGNRDDADVENTRTHWSPMTFANGLDALNSDA